jgi:hypothetical protein
MSDSRTGRVVGKVRRHGNGDKFYDDTVVLQRVVEKVSVGDRYVWVAGVVQDQRGRGDIAGVGDGRLFCVGFRVFFFPRRARPTCNALTPPPLRDYICRLCCFPQRRKRLPSSCDSG